MKSRSQADSPVFRVNSTLVQVDAVVTDSKGHQITNLTASDFQIYADGKLQTITNFSYVPISPPSPPLTPRANSTKDPALAAPPVGNVRREDVRRTIVLMVDDLNLSFESLAFVRASLLKFIDQQVQPGDLIAVCRTASGSGALLQFTSDLRIARNIIGGLRWNPNGLARTSFLEAYDHDSDLRSANQRARAQELNRTHRIRAETMHPPSNPLPCPPAATQ